MNWSYAPAAVNLSTGSSISYNTTSACGWSALSTEGRQPSALRTHSSVRVACNKVRPQLEPERLRHCHHGGLRRLADVVVARACGGAERERRAILRSSGFAPPHAPFDSTCTTAPKPRAARRLASIASASRERHTLPSDKSSTRTGPGSTLRLAISSLAAAAGVRGGSATHCKAQCACEAARATRGRRSAQAVARQLDEPQGGGAAAAAARRNAPRNERLARKEGATTTPVTSKWFAASGAPDDARRSSSALGHEPFGASPEAAAARAEQRRLRARCTRVRATQACGVAPAERTAKRRSGAGSAARLHRLVQPPAELRQRASRQTRREARAAVPTTLEAARRVRVVRRKSTAACCTTNKRPIWP